MKILLLNQFFWPDLAATSQLLTDVARELERRGNKVRVICGKSTYAGCAESSRPAVNIDYSPALKFSKIPAARLLSYMSFWILCVCKAIFGERPDVVLTLTTPPLLPLVGTLLKALSGCRHVIWEMDVYPELAVELGVISRNGVLTRTLRGFANLARKHADLVIALGDCMRERLLDLGVDSDRITVVENWANGELFQPSAVSKGFPLTVLYPGNLGLGHDVETLLSALAVLREASDPRFLFVGGGEGLEALRSVHADQQMSNSLFLPYEDPATLARERFSTAHVGLVTQRESCSGLLVPSKVYPLMAAGLPFIFIGPESATASRIIQRFQCGWHIPNGDYQMLVKTLRLLNIRRDLVADAGLRARRAFLENYDTSVGAVRLCDAVMGHVRDLAVVNLETEIRSSAAQAGI